MLKYITTNALVNLHKEIKGNIDSYRSGTFDNLLQGKTHISNIEFDVTQLQKLNMQRGRTSNVILADKQNSRLIGESLKLTPYQAQDARIWVYLTHSEGLEYSRSRWPIPDDPEKAIKAIKTHFFAESYVSLRDDNALSWLWWNDYLARKYSIQPMDRDYVPQSTSGLELNSYQNNLDVIMGNSDLRLNLVQRTGISRRKPLVQAIIRLCIEEGLHTNYNADNFRRFMRVINIIAPEKLLEVYDINNRTEPTEIDDLVHEAYKRARRLNAEALPPESSTNESP